MSLYNIYNGQIFTINDYERTQYVIFGSNICVFEFFFLLEFSTVLENKASIVTTNTVVW